MYNMNIWHIYNSQAILTNLNSIIEDNTIRRRNFKKKSIHELTVNSWRDSQNHYI